MAERRMFSKTVIDSDNFIDMPISARLLYYDLGMRADDDGFVNSPKKITRMIGASQDDLRILSERGFIIPFDTGVIVIRHWKVNNMIKKDRYHETTCRAEKQLLRIEKSSPYELKTNEETEVEPEWNQDGTEVEPQVRLGKDSKGYRNTLSSISCSEPLASSEPNVPPLMLNDNSEWLPTMEDLEGWKRLYAGVDVITELGRMREWLLSNPKKRKTAKGIRRFVTTWLDREQNRCRGKPASNGNKFNNFEQNTYDFDRLEKEIVANAE